MTFSFQIQRKGKIGRIKKSFMEANDSRTEILNFNDPN